MSLLTLAFSATVVAPLVLLVMDLVSKKPHPEAPAPAYGARQN
jgi:hypothetical protein